MSTLLKIAYLYKEQLNLYGDNGNIEVLQYRAKQRNIDVEINYIGVESTNISSLLKNVNLVFMGGGPDSGQKDIYKDLLQVKGPYLKEYIEEGGCGLFICGSFQLLGNYYKASDGYVMEGLGAFDMYTEHFGNLKPRCIGNTVATLSQELANTAYFSNYSNEIVGFENHGGRTFLSNNMSPLAHITKGHGNNSEDGSEGIFYKNSLGTYFHGPFLAKNPHMADFLIAKSLGGLELDPLEDTLMVKAFTASKKLKQ